ncbi:type II toxin-antitoxin system RelB/DinJ family antitoxin [Leptospirillum ferriphilum]|uniref:Damage-inducible protein n=2 Tax=Leptospirillum ferriphilum TaxID=178606 RepID=A0A059XVG0_9BACT|nr:type II toxin-antitoxin system RelB/DinJ family antitoxin [Leptospirillum ferriphilum]AIA31105.1 damage-inducible protein [Leptospirillum ferriphilum YSK]OOH72418.1 damage-inducible protein [Leptospirillum ferriphilum]
MATSTMIHVRIDEKIKKEATETLEDMGLSLSDAVRVFLKRVVADKQLPFELKVPNSTTRRAMEEADEIIHSKRTRYQNGSDLIGDLEKVRGQ